MHIGIIGSGNIGGTLARKLTKLGHQVWIANSRGPASLIELTKETGAKAVTVKEAAQAADMVILAVPTKAFIDLPQGLFAANLVVVDTSNYHPDLRDGRIEAMDQGMLESQWVAQQIGHPVIKAFNNVFARSLLEKGQPTGTTGRLALSAAGDSPDGKVRVLRLIDELGFDPIDGGDLNNSWRQQTGTPAYCQDLPAPALRQALAAADCDGIAEYRSQEEDRIKRWMAANEN